MEAYWRFAAARQAIYFRRLESAPKPWTVDPVLGEYKFTNAYRAADRTSQYLIRNVIYRGSQEHREVFTRVLIFKMFNRIGTWEAISTRCGTPGANTFDPCIVGSVLDEVRKTSAIYSAAYIMPPISKVTSRSKHDGHLKLVGYMLSDHAPEKLAECKSMREAYELLRRYDGIGPFLAYQLVTDLNYGPSLQFEERDFVIAGPGAKEGLRKCFRDRDRWSDEELIMWVTEHQEAEFERRQIQFPTLWGRRLQPIDVQNLFCEVAKYARVAFPEFTKPGGRTRIKQKYAASGVLPKPWFPPKWGLNDQISIWEKNQRSLV